MLTNKFDGLLPSEASSSDAAGPSNLETPCDIMLRSFLEIPKCENLDTLAQAINQVIPSNKIHPEDFSKDFNEISLPVTDYHEKMIHRYECFSYIETPQFLSAIHDVLDKFDSLEVRPLLIQTVKEVKTKKGYEKLFLLGVIIARRPDLISPSVFNFPPEEINEYAPVITWLIGHALFSEDHGSLVHLDPLVTSQILDIFLPVFSESEPTAVCVSYLLIDAFDKQKVLRSSSYHFVRLIQIVQSSSLASEILAPIIMKLSVVDKKELAHEMMSAFPNAPGFACDIFIREATMKGNCSFVDGWIEHHQQYHPASMKYLREVAYDLPESAINKFPMKDLKNGGERAALAVRKVELTNASFRLLFILVVLFVWWQVHIRYDIL